MKACWYFLVGITSKDSHAGFEERHRHFASVDSITNKDVPVILTRDPQFVHNLVHGYHPCFRDAIELKGLCTAPAQYQHTQRQGRLAGAMVSTGD